MDPQHELEKLDQQWVCNDERHQAAGRRRTFASIAWVAHITGFALVFLGLWLDELGEDVRLERLLYPWPLVAIVVGVCVIIGSLVLMVRNGRKLRAYYQEEQEYEFRRSELLQEIHGSDSQ